MNYFLKIFLIICAMNSFVLAKVPFVQFFSVGIKVFPSNNDVRFYAETSLWSYVGADAGIEIGTQSVEFYGEAQVGIGFLGYSHGLYYRIPYDYRESFYGWRGKAWAGGFYYASLDFDYTRNKTGFGAFASFPAVLELYKGKTMDELMDDLCEEQGVYCVR